MVDKKHQLSIRKQCKLLEINRSSLYFKPNAETDLNLDIMKEIDRINMKYPSFGVLRIKNELEEVGYQVNHKRIRRLMKKMGIEVIYPKRNLSRLGRAEYVHPYLLRNLNINRPNQVWQIDISYIPMKKGFMYLTAIIDVYSRFIVGWQVSNSLEEATQTELLNESIERYGKPEIINSDQGSQYTSKNWINCLKGHEIRISMDGKGRATDNIYVERFFRSIKYDYIYLNPAETGLDLYLGIKNFIEEYNQRKHQGIGNKKPKDLYKFERIIQLKSA